MKILYVNFIDDLWGHKRLDALLINYLAEFADVTVIAPKDWYENLPSNVNVIYYKPKSIFQNNSRIDHYLSLKIMKFAANVDKKENFDYIFAASFNTYAYAIGRVFFSDQTKIYILHHNNTDMLRRSKVDVFFKTYVKKVRHIVFEEFIANYLVEKYKLNKKKLLILPHPLLENRSVSKSNKFMCVGISNSNDERLINDIIAFEMKNEFLKENKLKVILRSKLQTFDNGYLKVIKGYLETDEYNYYINNSSSVFLPFSNKYNYRMSGSLVDALSNETIVIGTDITLVRLYSAEFPNICSVVSDSEEFFYRINSIKNSDLIVVNTEFEKFKKEHGSERVVRILYNEFKKGSSEKGNFLSDE